MYVRLRQTSFALLAVGLCLAGGLLTGCKKDAEFSQKEVDQFKQGPPKEMPPEARAAFERAMQNKGGGPATQPPAGGK